MTSQATDIQSILAALASQRGPPAAAPAPGQPPLQAPPTTYTPPQSTDQHPGAYPPPAAYGAAQGYQIPHPAAAGNMDLSAIRPVNSGTVSIADAIAKAKSYAAEAGVTSYDRPVVYSSHDARGGAPGGEARGDYRRRSRSRSPAARREGYRENYNPYRDERREDARAYSAREYGHHHGSGGDRSYSPDDRSRGPSYRNAGGRDRDRSPRGGPGGDDNSETIQIEGSLVGLIIGRQGENLRRIEGETGCRVQFLGSVEGGGNMRQCKISGPRARRADVKNSIDRIISDTGASTSGPRGGGGGGGHGPPPAKEGRGGAAALREGEDHMQIMVPDPTVGLIIGRGGETIRDLQERSGCHINIVGESKSMNGLRPVNLIGTVEAAQKAKDLIMEIVDSDSRGEGMGQKKPRGDGPPFDRQGGGGGGGGGYSRGGGGGGFGGGHGGSGGPREGQTQETIQVPADAVGMIIGKRGETIREIQNSTGCKINVSQSAGDGGSEREVTLVGSADSIERAKRAIEEKVDAVRMKGSGPPGGRGGRGGGSDYGYGGPSHGHGGGSAPPPQQQSQQSSAPPQAAASSDGADPYAQYGGYQNYVALWYQQWMSAGGGQPPSGDAPPQPPAGGQ